MEQNMKETVNQINMNWQWTKIKAMQDINIGDYIFLARDNVKKINYRIMLFPISISILNLIIICLFTQCKNLINNM